MGNQAILEWARSTPLGCWVGALFTVPLLAWASADLSDDPLRLDPRIRPLTQELRLELDPSSDGYTGVTRVELQFEIPTNSFRFHALELELSRASLDGQELRLVPGEAGLISATAPDVITPGVHAFEVAFTNDFNRDGTGLYKSTPEDTSFLFTQMAPVDARRAFPCWDEPGFKIPWRVTVTTPKALEAVGNMPVAVVTDEGERRHLEFGRTPPMPSYLIALAVGPFEGLSIAGQAVPGRIITEPGKQALARVAAEVVPPLFAALERYFGIPYPYPKLDHIAVPEFNWGAMENVGAITYRDAILLKDGESLSAADRRDLIEIVAHEIGHMWFGNLVTLQWWDDVWLNEAFATWVALKVGHQLHPDLRFDLAKFHTAAAARSNDTQPSVKAIRRTFGGGDNVVEAFDTLSYLKGQAVLSMIEGWIGETNFQAALTSYFRKHAWGNARAEDLWAAFAEQGDASLIETLRPYIEQPGIPELSFNRLPGNRLEVRQRRYRTLTATNVADQRWQVPMVLRFGVGSELRIVRLTLESESQTFAVPELDQAEWLYPNSDETGYYLWSLPPDLNSALAVRARHHLSDIERLGLLNTADKAVQAGTLGADQLLEVALSFASERQEEIRSQVVGILTGTRNLVATNDRPAYAQLLCQTLRPLLDQLALEPRPDETIESENLRGRLLTVLGLYGDDPEVIAFCRDAAERQIEDPRSVPASVAHATLSVATWHGDATWATQLRSAFEKAQAPDVRARFLSQLAGCRDPALVSASLDYALTDHVRPNEVMGFMFGRPETAAARFDWLTANYGQLKDKVAEDFLPFLPYMLAGGDLELLARGREFFLDPARKDPLTQLHVTQTNDDAVLEAELRKRNAPRLSSFLGTQNQHPDAQ